MRWQPLVLALLLCLPVGGGLRAQPLIHLSGDVHEMLIGKNISYHIDHDGMLSIADVMQPGFNSQWQTHDKESPNFGNMQATVWNKFTIANHSVDRLWYLVVENYNIDTLTLYQPGINPGSYTANVSGRSRPFSQRNIKTVEYAFPLKLDAGDSTTFYLKVDTYLFQYPLLLINEQRFIERAQKNSMPRSIYIGITLLIVLYNLWVFVSTRIRIFFWYIVYVLFTALFILEIDGFTAQLWGQWHPWVWPKGPTIIALSSISLLIFANQFLEFKKLLPLAYKATLYLLIPLFLLPILLNGFHLNLAASLANQILGTFIMFFLLAASILAYRKGLKEARFYIIASLFFFIGVFIFILKTNTILPHNYFTNNSMLFGSMLELILFSLSLADKMNQFRREKKVAEQQALEAMQANDRLIKEQNIMLEQKVAERTMQLHEEKDRSEALLLNILPFKTAQELKLRGKTDPQFFEEVTVIFTDFKDFTRISEQMPPHELVHEIDACFRSFDAIMEKHGVEKIKTIGDSYMAVGGLPVPDPMHATKVISAALDILLFMEQYNQNRIQNGKEPFLIRIGIHSGPVVAGIVGSKKFAYDIWGDTVNTASRMESSGAPGHINISEVTHQHIHNLYHCKPRGKKAAKNKGELDMYYVLHAHQTPPTLLN